MTTDFQTNLYAFIVEYIDSRQRPPTFAEMTAGMQISPRSKSLITRSLRALEKQGKLCLKKEGRYLHISPAEKKMPLLGRISAGMPIEAIPTYQFVEIEDFLKPANRFALKVKGDSMIGEGILDGDIIICTYTNKAREGEIVVALIDQQNATLKKISYQLPGMITLIPANETLKPRAYPAERILIQGIYIGLIRMR